MQTRKTAITVLKVNEFWTPGNPKKAPVKAVRNAITDGISKAKLLEPPLMPKVTSEEDAELDEAVMV